MEPRKISRLAILALSLVAAPSAFAWFDMGHMVVAEVAYRRLDPDVRKKANALLAVLNDPRTADFRTAACWADDFKSRENAHWHYTNYFFREDGKPSTNKPRDENVVWAIEKFTKVLSDGTASSASKNEALRFLIHFVGDVHQPLHATARECEDHPNGDRGGNDFKIAPGSVFKNSITNLHFVWDSGAGAFEDQVRPLNDQGQRMLARYADQAEAALPFADAKAMIAKATPNDWALESFELAKTAVYADIKEGQTPSEAYIKRAREVSLRRVALAGYRLADLLNRALK